MDASYIYFIGTAIVGDLFMMLVMYLVYRRGIAIRIAATMIAGMTMVAILGFFLGREGTTPANLGIAVIIGVTFAIGLFVITARHIITPVKLVAAAATSIAKGDVGQRVEIERNDELGDMAAAFQHMVAYLQETAGAADLLAQGDVTAEVEPRSEKDRLGNAFRRMIAYQQEMAAAADLLAQGDVAVDVMPRSEKDRLGHASRRMIAYQQEMAVAADRLAGGDLAADVEPRSERDRLGNAFRQMVVNLKEVVEDIDQTAQGLAEGNLSVTPKAEYKGDFVQI
jgi:methyl-accepting chemotaxis protein